MRAVDPSTLAQFLYREAALLDDGEWDSWGKLFTADGIYWVPAARDQSDPINDVSLIYDNALLRAIRLDRLKNAEASSLQGRPNSSRVVSNIMVLDSDDAKGRYVVRSRFVVAQYARWGTHTFHGSYTHEIRPQEGELRMALKRVDLVNVEGPLGDIVVLL